MKSNEVMYELAILSDKIRALLKSTQGDYFNEVDEKIEYDDAPDDRLYQCEIQKILENLENIKDRIDYLRRPIIFTGFLHKNENGRYETEVKEFTSGDTIEALIGTCGNDRWVISSIEHDMHDYYLVGYTDVKLEGLHVRIRK